MNEKLAELHRGTYCSRYRKRLYDFFVLRVLGLNDTPHRIALGVAVGMFVAWTPTIPFQMILTLALSALLGANKLVGQPVVWITNPVTAIPLYWFNFVVGCSLVPTDCSTSKFLSVFREVFACQEGFWETVRLSWHASLQFFWPLWAGSLFVGLALGLISYFLCLVAVRRYKFHKNQHNQ